MHGLGKMLRLMGSHVFHDEFCILQGLDISLEHFGIIGDHWTIIMIVTDLLIEIISQARIKDPLDLMLQQIFDMAVHQLSRIADCV